MGYAVIETGGKQYRVEVGNRVSIEKLEGARGSSVTFDKVLMVEHDGKMAVGTPYLSKTHVVGTIDRQRKSAKVRTFKYKPKKNIRKRRGHRQMVTDVRIEKIIGG